MNTVTGEQKLLAILAHLAYLLGGLGFIIAPLIIFLLKRDDWFVYDHAKQALVAHLAILAASVVVGLSSLLLVGLLLVPVLVLLWMGLLITSIIAAVKVSNGQLYRYPLIQSFVDSLS
ncbi:Hypothetical protein LUCI_0260 [Lucifera butyrica]|uniref:DUF4870 domain-containing protein n=1 Tax=Lucifera butyrica TaxID=1351585 RepID=A0A498R0U3_9FIRM|nr:DUF4870 domain-containing protein [Lucifera butyrica]VBB05054.1 Hypothetical protein LUCI_0260 [Lucifera butyrica]